MHPTLGGVDPSSLERSCNGRRDRMLFGPSTPGLERAEVSLASCAFEPHRHDTYAIGVTVSGIQRFRYRGSQRIGMPGQLHILHPDETHDGAPATDAGLRYRILYVAPELVAEALGGTRPLPFVSEPVRDATPGLRDVLALLADIDQPFSELRKIDAVTVVADALVAMSGSAATASRIVDTRAVAAVRDHLAAHAREQTPAAVLEDIAGVDRFTITRDFRRVFGTTPDRYRAQRRLAIARAAIERGESLVRASADAGFADQSHMTRQFKRTYGLTPGRWAALTSVGSNSRR